MSEPQRANEQKAEMEPTLSVDADPVPPRVSNTSEGRATSSQILYKRSLSSQAGNRTADMLNPPPTWKFNKFLVELAERIEKSDLTIMKDMFRGDIGKDILEKTNTARDLFDLMCTKMYLNQDNLVPLQSLLMITGRRDLINLAMEYAQEVGDIIYFHPAPPEPLKGLTKVKVHVEGKDFSVFNREWRQDLRTKVSNWLFIPPQYVTIAGVEPSLSMIITLLIPDLYAEILIESLKQDSFGPFVELEMDSVQVGEETYHIQCAKGDRGVEADQQRELISVYEQLHDKTKQVQHKEKEVNRLSQETKMLKKSVVELQSENQELIAMAFKSEDVKRQSPTIVSTSMHKSTSVSDNFEVAAEQQSKPFIPREKLKKTTSQLRRMNDAAIEPVKGAERLKEITEELKKCQAKEIVCLPLLLLHV